MIMRTRSIRKGRKAIASVIEKIEERVLFAAFQPGDLAVYQVGNGSTALGAAAAPVSIDEYSPTGTLVQSIALPSTSGSTNPLTATGTSTNGKSEGSLTLSANGQNLLVPGYDAPAGQVGVATTNTSTNTGTISAASSATPTVLTVTSGSSIESGDNVTVSLPGVTFSPSQSTYYAKFVSSTSFSLYTTAALSTGVSATGTVTGAGSWTDNTVIPREVGVVSSQGAVNTSTTLGTAFNETSIWGAASPDGANGVYAVGGNGIDYTTVGSTSNATVLNAQSTYGVEISNGQLYVTPNNSSDPLTSVGAGLPTTAGQTLTELPGVNFSGTSDQGVGYSREFAFATLNPGDTSPDTLYVADDYNDGVDKLSLVSGSWVLNGEIGQYPAGGTPLAGVTGIVAEPTAAGEQLFISTASTIYTITDSSGYNAATGSDFTATPPLTVLATASANEAFRGIAFVPQPAGAPTLTTATQPTSQAAVQGATATFSAQAYGTNVSVQWEENENNGQGYQPIPGAIFTTLTVPNTTLAGNGFTYEAVFTNASGSMTSNPATLNVIPGPEFAFSTTTYTAPSTAGPVTITVNRFGDTSDADTVSYATSNGSALAGTNYTAASGMLTFPAGSAAAQTFTVTPTYVSSQTSALSFNITLTFVSGNPNETIPAPTAAFSITSPAEALNLSSSTYLVNDSDGTAVFSVNRTGGTADAGSVPYTVTTNSSGTPYTGTVNFAAGQAVAAGTFPITTGVSAPITGSITGATDPTGSNPIVITTSAASMANLTSGSVVTIASVGGNTTANGIWFAKVLSTTTFSLYHDSGLTLPVTSTKTYTSGGTWTAGEYAVTLGSPTGFTTSGALDGSSAVAPFADVTADAPYTSANASNLTGSALNLSGTASSVTDIETSGPYGTTYAPVVGDSAAGTGSFSYLAYEVLEFSPSTTPALYPTLGTTVNTGGIDSLSLQIFNTDASGTDNYSGHIGNFNVYFLPDSDATTPTSSLSFSTSATPSGLLSSQFHTTPILIGTFSFNNTAGYDTYTPATIPSTVASDLIADLNAGSNFRLAVTPETYGVVAMAADWAGFYAGETPTLSIAAAQTVNQVPEFISFQNPTYSEIESGGNATITLTRDNAAGTPTDFADTATVQYTTSNGTAIAGTNYTAETNQTATFAAGSATTTFTIPVADVTPQGGDKALSITLASPMTGSSSDIGGLGSQSAAILTISDASTAPTTTLTPAITDAADVEGGGPYVDTEIKAEGSAAGTYPSYGVVDFTGSAQTTPVTAIDNITLSLTNEPSVVAGPVDFYLVPDASSNILPSSPQSKNPHFFDTTQEPNGFGAQFGTPLLLGVYNLTDTTGGDVLSVPLIGYSQATEATLISYLNAGDEFRIVAAPGNSTVYADWASGSTSVSIGVQQGTPGTPAIGSFTASPVVTGSLATLTASNVTDGNPSDPIEAVNFYNTSTPTPTFLGTGVQNGSTWTLSGIPTAGLAAGPYPYEAVAIDFTGATATSTASLTVTGSQLIAWDLNGQGGTTGNEFGTSPLADTVTDPSVTNSGQLTRGAGISTTGTGAANAWGGTGFSTTASTAAAAVTAGDYVTFGLTIGSGYSDSLSSINLNYRHSATGPANGEIQYEIGTSANSTFTPITGYSETNLFGASGSSVSGTVAPINLSSISALQNLPMGTVVTFRIVPYGAPSTGGTWYINDGGNNSTTDLSVNGTSTVSNYPGWLSVPAGASVTWNQSAETLNITAGTATIIADPNETQFNGGAGDEPNITVNGSTAGLEIAPTDGSLFVHIGGLTVTGGADVDVASLGAARSHSNHEVLVVGPAGASSNPTFSVDSTSTLNMEDNDLLIHTGGAKSLGQAELAAVQSLAYGTGGGRNGGHWTGNELTSSAAAARRSADRRETTQLAVVLNNDLSSRFSSWVVGSASEALNRYDIIVKYTYTGDFSLAGSVAATDSGVLGLHYNTSSDEWADGDTNDDGSVNSTDAGNLGLDFNDGTSLATITADQVQL